MELRTLKDLKAKSKNPMWNMGYEECMNNSKREVIKWIKLKKEIDRLEEIKDEEYSKWCKKRDTYSDEYYGEMDKLQKPIDDLYKEFEKFGISFTCADYSGDICLNLNGLVMVLKSFFNITEKD